MNTDMRRFKIKTGDMDPPWQSLFALMHIVSTDCMHESCHILGHERTIRKKGSHLTGA